MDDGPLDDSPTDRAFGFKTAETIFQVDPSQQLKSTGKMPVRPKSLRLGQPQNVPHVVEAGGFADHPFGGGHRAGGEGVA